MTVVWSQSTVAPSMSTAGVVYEGWMWLRFWIACELFLPYKAFVTLTRRNTTTELGSLRVMGTGYPTE